MLFKKLTTMSRLNTISGQTENITKKSGLSITGWCETKPATGQTPLLSVANGGNAAAQWQNSKSESHSSARAHIHPTPNKPDLVFKKAHGVDRWRQLHKHPCPKSCTHISCLVHFQIPDSQIMSFQTQRHFFPDQL